MAMRRLLRINSKVPRALRRQVGPNPDTFLSLMAASTIDAFIHARMQARRQCYIMIRALACGSFFNLNWLRHREMLFRIVRYLLWNLKKNFVNCDEMSTSSQFPGRHTCYTPYHHPKSHKYIVANGCCNNIETRTSLYKARQNLASLSF